MIGKRAVVLLSGGLDSQTCLVHALNEGYEVYAISFDYGQKHRAELNAAIIIAEHHRVSHKIIDIHALGQLGGSALTDDNIEVQDHKDSRGIPNTYVPARNIIFLSIALSYAEIIGAEVIYWGANKADRLGYPDCRPEFFQAFQNIAKMATKSGVEKQAVKIFTPFAELEKKDIIKLGHQLGIEYGMSVSCYRADDSGRACGQCDSCYLRKQGFIEAGVPDRTRYY